MSCPLTSYVKQAKWEAGYMQPKLRLCVGRLVQALGECDLQRQFKAEQQLLHFKIVGGTQQPLVVR